MKDFDVFRGCAREQQKRLATLLACRRRFGLFPNSVGADLAKVKWTRDIVDPEFRKNVQIVIRLIAGAIGICGRKRAEMEKRSPTGASRSEDTDQLRWRLDDLRHLMTLPDGAELTLDALLTRRFELEQTLLELGDEKYVRSRAADLYDEEKGGTVITWKELYEDPQRLQECTFPPPLLADAVPRYGGANSSSDRASSRPEAAATSQANQRAQQPDSDEGRTRMMLARLLAVKHSTYLPLRARRELKQRLLLQIVVPVTLLLTVLFAVAIALVEDENDGFLLTAAGGAAGAALGSLIKLRDEIRRGAEMREFRPLFFGQIIVGAAAGLLAFVTAQAGIVRLGGGTSGLAAFGFVLGFSEAAFLGLVGRIAGGPGQHQRDNGTTGRTPKASA